MNYISSQSGNWSNPATWGGAGVPGNGDTATIQHVVVVDVDSVIGQSLGNGLDKALSVLNGSLTIASGATLTVRGDVITGNAPIILQPDASWKFGASLAPAGTKYVCYLGNSSGQYNAKLQCLGTQQAHCSVSSVIPGSRFRYGQGSGAWQDTGNFDCSWTDFDGLGDAATDAILSSQSNTVNSTFNLQHCTFNRCGRIYSASTIIAAASVTVDYNRWTNPAGSYDLRMDSVPPNAGVVRSMTNNSFSINTEFYDAAGWVFDGTYFPKPPSMTGSRPWASFRGVFMRQPGDSAFDARGDMGPCYFYVDGVSHSHLVEPHLACRVSGVLMEPSASSDAEGFEAPQAETVIERCIMLPSADGLRGVSLFNGAVPGTVKCHYNTHHVRDLTCGMIEDFTPAVGQVGEYYDNLAIGLPGAASAYHIACVGHQSDPQNSLLDIVNGSQCHHNARYKLSPGYMGKGYNVNCSVAPGASDIDLGTVGPQFADPTRNLSTWDLMMGGPGTAASGLARIQADPTLTALSLIPWVTAGFAPTNQSLKGAASDGSDIGAVPVGGVLPLHEGDLSHGQEQVTINLPLSAPNATGGVPGYTYAWYRRTVSGFTPSGAPISTQQSFTDTGLASGTTYYYVVVVTDSVGTTTQSPEMSFTA